jgi:hypothetical protein
MSRRARTFENQLAQREELLTLVLNSEPWHPSHVFDIRRHERSAECERMRGDRGVEILDPQPSSFQRRLDATVRVTQILD